MGYKPTVLEMLEEIKAQQKEILEEIESLGDDVAGLQRDVEEVLVRAVKETRTYTEPTEPLFKDQPLIQRIADTLGVD